jgi:hypothetical protein
MQKNTVLIIAGVADFFFGSNSTKSIKNKESLLEGVQNIVDKKNYNSIINLTTPHETFNSVNPLKTVRPQSVINFTLHSEEFLHKNNEISLTTQDNDRLLLDGNQLDFLLRPEDYDVHICGIDLNGSFKNIIEELLDKGYHVTVYSDAIRPFTSTSKYISSLIKTTSKFRYCSHKSIKTSTTREAQ